MRKKDDYTKHDVGCLILQAVFFIVCLFFLIRGVFGDTIRVTGWFYFSAVGGWFGLSLVLFAVSRGRFRHFLTVVFMMVNAFLVPFAVYGSGAGNTVAAAVGACYVIGIVIVASNDVAVGAFFAALAFAYTFHRLIAGPDVEHTTADYFWIALSYVGLIVIALGWRIVITRLYLLVKGKAMPGQVSEAEYHEVDDENKRLRRCVAQHISQMNKLTGYEPTVENKQ